MRERVLNQLVQGEECVRSLVKAFLRTSTKRIFDNLSLKSNDAIILAKTEHAKKYTPHLLMTVFLSRTYWVGAHKFILILHVGRS